MQNSRRPDRPTVFVAGATGYLGRHICSEYHRRGWHVIALVRDVSRVQDLAADTLVEAEATRPETLVGIMDDADIAISALGITRQVDGLTYREVDYQANANLLAEAQRAGVTRFGYVHVLNSDSMAHVPLVAAKSAFVRRLKTSGMARTVIAPSGYFSDMGDFLRMAESGRVWLFGSVDHRINPIHGADLAAAIADAMAQGRDWLDVGGPDVLSHTELAEMASAVVDRPVRIIHLPDRIRRILLSLLPALTPQRVSGPATFFLTAMGIDMVGERSGTRHLADYFSEQAPAGERQNV